MAHIIIGWLLFSKSILQTNRAHRTERIMTQIMKGLGGPGMLRIALLAMAM
jgi:hypothetical protein